MSNLRQRLERLDGRGRRQHGVYIVRTSSQEEQAREHAAERGDTRPTIIADTYFYNQVHSKSPGNRDHVTDSDIDSWAEAQQVELDPTKRKDLQRKIWDKIADQVYRPVTARGMAFEVYQPWLRGIRFGGALGDNSYYYEWGDQIAEAWLDK